MSPFLHEQHGGQKYFRVHVSGTECYAFSNMGKREGIAHGSHLTFLCWLLVMRQEQPDLIIHENVCTHPESLLADPLGDLYSMLPLRFDPYCLGWPMRRCGFCPQKAAQDPRCELWSVLDGPWKARKLAACTPSR